jgi:hypothetical protein
MASWLELSRDLKKGDRVAFARSWDVFPETVVPAGAIATVVENSLNEMEPTLFLLPDDPAIREALRRWSGEVYLYGPDHPDSPEWGKEAPVRPVA